jgi:hypothetical protein
MTVSSQPTAPRLGIFWLIEHPHGKVQLISASCPLDQAEEYGDHLTFGPGHYDLWEKWRTDIKAAPALRTIVDLFEYESWPRGRIVYDRPRDRFIIYADRKLLIPPFIRQIQARFHLPPERVETATDDHYRSSESPRLPL